MSHICANQTADGTLLKSACLVQRNRRWQPKDDLLAAWLFERVDYSRILNTDPCNKTDGPAPRQHALFFHTCGCLPSLQYLRGVTIPSPPWLDRTWVNNPPWVTSLFATTDIVCHHFHNIERTMCSNNILRLAALRHPKVTLSHKSC